MACQPDDSFKQRTYAQSLCSFLTNEQHRLAVQDAVCRMHRIKVIASEFFALHINRCLDENEPLPDVTQTWVTALFMHASYIKRDANGIPVAHVSSDANLDETISRVESGVLARSADELSPVAARNYDKPSRTGLSQIFSTEAITVCTTYNVNIVSHFKARVRKFVKWTFQPDGRIPASEYKQLKLELAQVANDLCRNGKENTESPPCYIGWIKQYRIFFGLDGLLGSESLSFALGATPTHFIPAMRLMNRAFEGSGSKTFAIVPLTTTLRPGFIGFDTRSIGTVLGVGQPESAKSKAKEQTVKRNEAKRNGTYQSPNERKEAGKVQAESKKKATKEIREAQRIEYAKLSKKDRAETKRRRRDEMKCRQLANRDECVQRRRVDSDSKDEFYGTFANIKVHKKGFVFNHSFKTDGVSVRLFFVAESTNGETTPLTQLPRRGLFAIDTIRQLSKLTVDEMQVIGIDPGMIDIIHCVDSERILKGQLTGSPPTSVVYTSKQRRHELCSVLYAKRMEEEKKSVAEVREAEDAMSQFNKRSTEIQTLLGYFDTRRSAMSAFESFYGLIRYRARRWRTFQKNQRSLDHLITRLKSMQTKTVMVLAYGSGVNAIANLKPSGIASCINMGLRNRLAKHFVVADTPEHFTSKICSACHGPCG